MVVSVFNAEGLLTTKVALRSIMNVGAEHVPQGLTFSESGQTVKQVSGCPGIYDELHYLLP
jgi:hypothetical protein